MGSSQTPNIIKVKAEVDEINRIVDELFTRLVTPEFKVTTVMPKVHVDNIWSIPKSVVVDTREEKRERKKRKLRRKIL